MYKKLIVGLIITMSSLYCMESSQFIPSGMMLLNTDIARNQIQSRLTFQEISRCKQLSKYCNGLYDIGSKEWTIYACNHCGKSYFHCMKMLVYFALHRNEEMFNQLWVHHQDIRRKNVAGLINKHKKKTERVVKGEKLCYRKPEITIKDGMHCYRGSYSKLKNIYRHMFDSAMRAIRKKDIVLANTFLSGSGLSLFDLSKKRVEDFDDLEDAFYQACLLHNADLIKNMCGGCVDDRSFSYIMYYADAQLLFNLIDKDILPADSAIQDSKKSVLHYAAERGLDNVAKIALEKGAYANARDCYEKTPLQYAVQKAYLGVVTEILSSSDADVRCKDKTGKTAIDYNTPRRKHLFHIPQRTEARKEIARMLQDHKDQHQVSGYSYSKVHANGYQMMHL